ncbi:MAG: hypothetical protein DRJ98_05870 [Thermoprotei archaeon]|nr:MAG: hypothetical protein DRJ98_05870 [Thermoprotei archaeon]
MVVELRTLTSLTTPLLILALIISSASLSSMANHVAVKPEMADINSDNVIGDNQFLNNEIHDVYVEPESQG